MNVPDDATRAALLDASSGHITFAVLPDSMVRAFEYGVRLDLEALAAANDQIKRSRTLYNELVALMHALFEEMNAWLLKDAGGRAVEIDMQVRALTEAFNKARSGNDKDAMRARNRRRQFYRELALDPAETARRS